MLNFISFGSGSCGNCYFFYNEEEGLMVDVGIGVRTLKKHFHNYGLKLNQIQNIIVTHDHADHIKSVGSISKDLNIPVYATDLVHRGIERNYCVRAKIPADCKKILENGVPVVTGNFEITSFHVPHDSLDCVGYKIRHNGLTIVLATDVGDINDDIRQAISEADYLIIEANHDENMLMNGPYSQHLKQRVSGLFGHMSNKTCGDVIARHASDKLKHIFLCHLSEENNHPELARITIEQILAGNQKNIGEKLKLDVLKRKVPTGIFRFTAADRE